jgi:hypothetical protein
MVNSFMLENDEEDLALEEAGKIAEAEQKLIDLFYRNIEEEQWDELHKLLKGQDYTKFKKKKSFDDQCDGSGLRSWWD